MGIDLLPHQLNVFYTNVSQVMHNMFFYPAHNGWLRGFPTEEVAFTNRLTEKLSTSRNLITRDRDFGDFMISWDVYKLHRQNNNKDLFECDIAFTLRFERNIPNELKNKTAFFQIKKSGNRKDLIRQVQQSQKLCSSFIFNNSFVMVIGEKDQDIDICSFRSVLDGDLGDRTNSERWFADWMSCFRGTMDNGENISALHKYLLLQTDNEYEAEAIVLPKVWVVYEVALSPWFWDQQ